MAVVVVGTAVVGDFGFAALGEVLSSKLGGWAYRLFAIGLLGAGLLSAITAPLAAAITARDLFSEKPEDERWSPRSWRYRSVGGSILAIGVFFGVSGIRPIPAIILAQALNGVLLPLVSIFLLIVINDRTLMKEQSNGSIGNLLMGGVVWISLLLGVFAVWRAVARTLGLAQPQPIAIIVVSVLAAGVVAVPILRLIGRRIDDLGSLRN
jgi:Mn2+/Fe2+ NRAMP family transporter